jgi:hypothetical protein
LKPFKAFGTVLRWIFTPIIALVLIFEEWGWEPLAALLARLARLPMWASMERWIASLPPWAALIVLGTPTLALFPIKLLALYLLGAGHAVVGATVLILAKLAGTALLARLFSITQPALMQLGWFARWYPRWKAWKDALMDRVRASGLWQLGKRTKMSIRFAARRLKALFKGD